MQLLEVQSSVRENGSISRQLSREFAAAWRATHPDGRHVLRDVGTNPPPHPTADFTVANYTPPAQRTKDMRTVLETSEVLIEELLAADRLLLGVPMYNFSVPSGFKAYLDQVVRVGRTFDFDPERFSFAGRLHGKKALVIMPSAGNYGPVSPAAAMDFCGPYVKSILGFLGIVMIEIITVPNQFLPAREREQEAQTARQKLLALMPNW